MALHNYWVYPFTYAELAACFLGNRPEGLTEGHIVCILIPSVPQPGRSGFTSRGLRPLQRSEQPSPAGDLESDQGFVRRHGGVGP